MKTSLIIPPECTGNPLSPHHTHFLVVSCFLCSGRKRGSGCWCHMLHSRTHRKKNMDVKTPLISSSACRGQKKSDDLCVRVLTSEASEQGQVHAAGFLCSVQPQPAIDSLYLHHDIIDSYNCHHFLYWFLVNSTCRPEQTSVRLSSNHQSQWTRRNILIHFCCRKTTSCLSSIPDFPFQSAFPGLGRFRIMCTGYRSGKQIKTFCC